MSDAPPIGVVKTSAFTVPTDRPEADGTFAWDKTTLVLCEVEAGGETGLGFSYTGTAAAELIGGPLKKAIEGLSAFDPPRAWTAMQRAVRNLGRPGLCATAISAVDLALWDLKAKLHGLPLCRLLGQARDAVPIYGSGGFTTYTDAELEAQLGGWVERDGCRWMKMKVGTDPSRDPHRVAVAKRAIGGATLFVDANGALSVKEALRFADVFAEYDVAWFEEPVTSDDLDGLRLVRERAPAGMDVAAGEYGYTLDDARRMLVAGAVDCLQADATRTGGVTGFLRVAALAEAHHIDLSGHCAPSMHRHSALAAPNLRHLEWFHDHVRIEHMLFDGAPAPEHGAIRPDLSRPGHGLALRRADAEPYRVA
ncbi:enolase C-terminal domain-like protein [Lichenibacterium dinghuense]|uniref:enolase C-terminal domain-like protein n=1 Tax=Lichenibacterium dinghuense TaxID=2895977 RepID=UPI001F441AF7|nr:enolase C-terminal domain-like protein [Lichenibacterium sp. 6Y81]